MKSRRMWLIAAIGVAGSWASLPAAADNYQDSTAASMSAPGSDPVAQAIDAIRKAREPSEAVQAYAQGAAAAPDDVALADAYVRRMADFDVAEMAAAQAERLIQRDPNHGLAWAVVAQANATRGRMTQALEEIVTAAAHARDEPFVQQTAGHLLAWYDTRATRSDFPQTLQHALEQARRDLADQSAFKDAYREARGYYERRSTTTYAPPPPVDYDEPVYAPPTSIYPSYYGPDYGLYTAPLYPTYSTYAPYNCFPYPTYVYPSVFVVEHHHRRFDGFRHRFGGVVHRDGFLHDRGRDGRHGVGVGFGDGRPGNPSRSGPIGSLPRVSSRGGAVLGRGDSDPVMRPGQDRSGPSGNVSVRPGQRRAGSLGASSRPQASPRPAIINTPQTIRGPRSIRGPGMSRGTSSPPAFRSISVPRATPAPSFRRPSVTRSAASPPSVNRAPVTRFSMPSRGITPAPTRAAPSVGSHRGGQTRR